VNDYGHSGSRGAGEKLKLQFWSSKEGSAKNNLGTWVVGTYTDPDGQEHFFPIVRWGDNLRSIDEARSRQRRRHVALFGGSAVFGLLLIAAIVLGIMWLASGSGGDKPSAPTPSVTATQQPQHSSPPSPPVTHAPNSPGGIAPGEDYTSMANPVCVFSKVASEFAGMIPLATPVVAFLLIVLMFMVAFSGRGPAMRFLVGVLWLVVMIMLMPTILNAFVGTSSCTSVGVYGP
jgi:hypothetical protein